MSECRQAGQVRAELDRILSSEAFAGSDQLKRLLQIIVERTVAGDSDVLKEYNLGLDAFQRPPDYDPKLDPIVRVQARRLRSKLDEYYAGQGAGDPLVIRVPKGGYVPVFELRSRTRASRVWFGALAAGVLVALFLTAWTSRRTAASPADPDRSIAVLPLKNFIGEEGRSSLPDEITEILTTELARSSKLRVVSRTTAGNYVGTAASLPQIARQLGVRWMIEGGLGSEGHRVYVKLRVVDSQSDRKVWADVYDSETTDLRKATAAAAARLTRAIESRLNLPSAGL